MSPMERIVVTCLDELRIGLETELAASRGGPPCVVPIYPGAQAVADWCRCGQREGGCGMGWVRLVRAFASTANYPIPDVKPNPCNAIVAAVLEVGAFRCVPTPNAQGQMDAVDLTRAALDQASDMTAMLRAINCSAAVAAANPILGTYSPNPPGGDCGGGAWQLTVQLA